jgi:hypothetical protein
MWVKLSDFTRYKDPNDSDESNSNEREYTELLPLKDQVIQTPQICNISAASDSFCIEVRNSETGSNSSKRSKKINVRQQYIVSFL